MTDLLRLTQNFKDKILTIKEENDINFKSQATDNILGNQYTVRECIKREFSNNKLGHPIMYSLGLCCALDKEQLISCITTDDINHHIFSSMIDISATTFQSVVDHNYYNSQNLKIFVKCLCGQNIKNLYKVVLDNNSNLIFGCICILKNKIHLQPEFVIKLKKETKKLKQMKEEEKTKLKQMKEEQQKIIDKHNKVIAILSKRYSYSNLDLRIKGYNLLCNNIIT